MEKEKVFSLGLRKCFHCKESSRGDRDSRHPASPLATQDMGQDLKSMTLGILLYLWLQASQKLRPTRRRTWGKNFGPRPQAVRAC